LTACFGWANYYIPSEKVPRPHRRAGRSDGSRRPGRPRRTGPILPRRPAPVVDSRASNKTRAGIFSRQTRLTPGPRKPIDNRAAHAPNAFGDRCPCHPDKASNASSRKGGLPDSCAQAQPVPVFEIVKRSLSSIQSFSSDIRARKSGTRSAIRREQQAIAPLSIQKRVA